MKKRLIILGIVILLLIAALGIIIHVLSSQTLGEELVGQGRPQSIAEPRQVAMYLCRRMTRASLDTIGASFNRNHSTVVHACKAVRGTRSVDAEFKARIDGIVRALGRDPDAVLED